MCQESGVKGFCERGASSKLLKEENGTLRLLSNEWYWRSVQGFQVATGPSRDPGVFNTRVSLCRGVGHARAHALVTQSLDMSMFLNCFL